MKRARPQGLGTNFKKERADEDIQAHDTPIVETKISDGTGKLFYELPEDATALDQLRALFESATMFLGNEMEYLKNF